MSYTSKEISNRYLMLPADTIKHEEKCENLYLNMYTYCNLNITKSNNTKDHKATTLGRKQNKKYIGQEQEKNLNIKKSDRVKVKITTTLDKKFKDTYTSREHEKNLLKKIHSQMQFITNAYKTALLQFEFKVPGRIILGNSGGNYGNTSILALHPTYCIPYIPSSSIKGAFRSYMIYTRYGGDEKRAMKHEDFRRIFGASDLDDKGEDSEKGIIKDKGQKGGVMFLDAFPKDSFELHQDIQTVHYKNYYDMEENSHIVQPTDDMNTVPLTVYAVGKTTFVISALFSDPYFTKEKQQEFKLCFQETFTEFGIGAKTSIGYGLGEVL